MVTIRLRKVSKSKKRYHFRIVVCDAKISTSGRCIEELGYYDPTKKPELLKIDTERLDSWKKKGAKLSATVERLLRKYTKKEEKVA